MKLKKIILSALFAALTCVATFIVRIPSPMGGYINLGDCMVLLSGWFLGPVYGFLSAAVGSALADISAGYIIYAPATFVIKGVMALVAAYIYTAVAKKNAMTGNVLSGIVAEIIMIAGYFVFEVILYDLGGALVNIPANAVQGIAGIIAATLLSSIIKRNMDKFFS